MKKKKIPVRRKDQKSERLTELDPVTFVRCPECGNEQADMGRNVACEECGYGPMPCATQEK